MRIRSERSGDCARQCFALALTLLALILPGSICWASGWEKLDTVHFNSCSPDFGTVPRRAAVAYEATDRPIGEGHADGNNPFAKYELSDDGDEGRRVWRKKLSQMLFHRASIEERKGHWAAEQRIFEEYGRRLGWTGFIRDRIEALSAFQQLSTRDRSRMLTLWRKYLGGLSFAETGQSNYADEAFRKVLNDPAAGFLAEHAQYQLASQRYEAGEYKTAIFGYQEALRRFPKGSKSESALIMIARCSIIPAKNAADTVIGSDAIKRLLAEYPQTRFRSKCFGLAARVHLLSGRLPESAWCYFQVGDLASVEQVRKAMPQTKAGKIRVWLFAEYLKRLASTKSYYVYSQTIYALDRLTKELTGTDAFRINVRLWQELEVASSYLEYRLYHCENTPKELHNLSHLADKIASSHPISLLSPGVRVRLAEVCYRNHQYKRALEWVARANTTSDRALFVKGSSLYKLHRIDEALKSFETLVNSYPNSNLEHGAREELALLYEEKGYLERALKEYFRLGYQCDAAYLIDVRMSIPQLKRYLEKYADEAKRFWNIDRRWYYEREPASKEPKYTEKELIAYSLGIRYFRRERWNEAAHWLRAVPRQAYLGLGTGRGDEYDGRSPDPLTAIRDLSRLQRLARQAMSYNARAETAYNYASYYYKHGLLLLYNWGAWQDQRRECLSDLWDSGHSMKGDERAIREHMYEHEIHARTLALCKDIARRYPKSPTAPKALFRAACSASHLGNFNDWWRAENKWKNGKDRGQNLDTEASHLMKTLARRYPKSPLASDAAKYAEVFASYVHNGRESRAFRRIAARR